jgi:molybdopterin synthase sulfur carrier subunit
MTELRIRYFAWLKQRTGCAEETLVVPEEIGDVAALKHFLGHRHPRFAEACAASGVVRCAVNHEHVDEATMIRDGDEVAFFPPVTGG